MPGTLASLRIKLGLDATGVEQGVTQAERSFVGLSSGAGMAMRSAGTLLGSGLSLAANGALEMEERAARFRAETGASAEEAHHFSDAVNAAAGSSLLSTDDIAASATRIRTDLGLTGAAAETTLGSFLRYERATGQGADAVLAFDDILDAWNLTAADTGAIMDTLVAGHQTCGGSISESQDLLARPLPSSRAPTWPGSRVPSSSTCSTRRAATRAPESPGTPRSRARWSHPPSSSRTSSPGSR